jgi:hypothetical protein
MGGRIILDLCGGSGAWSKPYVAAGFDVRLVTVPKLDVMSYEPPCGVTGILAAPPCEMFSVGYRGGIDPHRWRIGLAVVRRCLEIVEQCQLDTPLLFWALENPTGHLRKFLGKPPMSFCHWHFGDTGIKPTDLWGDYQRPKRVPDVKAAKSNYQRNSHLKRQRAITPPGFARAFYAANH